MMCYYLDTLPISGDSTAYNTHAIIFINSNEKQKKKNPLKNIYNEYNFVLDTNKMYVHSWLDGNIYIHMCIYMYIKSCLMSLPDCFLDCLMFISFWTLSLINAMVCRLYHNTS